MDAIRVFFAQSWMTFRSLYGWLRTDTFIWAKLVQPLSALALFTLIARYALEVSDLSYYIIGNAMVACWTTAFAGITVMLSSDRVRGTLPYLILTPTNRFVLFAGRAFFYLVDGFGTVLFALVAGSLLFSLSYAKANLGAMVLSVLVGVIGVSCAGMLLGAFALIYRDVNTLINVSMSMLLIFAGVNFPASLLPPYLSWIAQVLPLTRSVMATRQAYHGASFGQTAPLLAIDLGLAVLYLLAGYVLFVWCEREARIRATLDLY